MGLKQSEGWSIPPDAPAYPPLPAVYRNVKSQFVFFTAPKEAVGQFLPEPLLPSQDGICVAAGMEVPFCTNYGAFVEAFLLLKCNFGKQEGYYCSHVFHDGPAGIAAGREIYGTPKRFARMSVRREERAIVTEAFVGGSSALRVSSIIGQAVPYGSMPALAPSWRLKIIPRADAPGPALKQLIDCASTTRDLVVHFLARGEGAVTLGTGPDPNLSTLNPLSYLGAFYMESSFSEHYASIAYDYLQAGQNTLAS